MKKTLFVLVVLVCIIRIINYGIYTMRDQNKAGAVGLFALAFITAVSSGLFLMID